VNSLGGSSDSWVPDDWDDLNDSEGGPRPILWVLIAVALAVLLVVGVWYVDEYHRATAPPPTAETLGSIFSFGTPVDASQPTLNHWEWDLTYHVNLSGGTLTLGDMEWRVAGGPSGSVNNVTAFDAATASTAAVWDFAGGWTYEAGYDASTVVANQFVWLLYGSASLVGETVTMECPEDTPYVGQVSVTLTS
jgi:hypothetical protein